MAIIGGNSERKEIGLQLDFSGTYTNTIFDTNTGLLKLKAYDVDGTGKPVYYEEGNWISDVIDLQDNFADFDKVFVTNVDNGASRVAVLTRISDDGLNWSDWVATAYDGTIQSDTKRYVQVRVNFFAGFESDTYQINKSEFSDSNEFVESKAVSFEGYIPLTFTSNTAKEEGFPFSSSNYSSSYYAYKAFDNNISSQVRPSSTERENYKVGFCFSVPRLITKYKLIGAGGINASPVNWDFQASNDTTTGLDGTWVDLDKQSGIVWNSTSEEKEFSFSNMKKYKAYRIHVTKNGGSTNYSSFGELQFYQQADTNLRLKREYEFDMTLDTTWSEEGSLHKKEIVRDDWLTINKLEPTKKDLALKPITWDSTKVNHSSTKFSNNDMTVYLYNLGQTAIATEGKTDGKWYWEIETTSSILNSLIGVSTTDTTTYNTNKGIFYSKDGRLNFNTNSSYGTSYVVGDVIGVALDLDLGTIEFYKNGVSQGVANANVLSMDGDVYYPAVSTNGGSSGNTYNLIVSKDSFKYPIPNGYNPYQLGAINKTLILHDGEYKRWNEKTKGDTKEIVLNMVSNDFPSPFKTSASSNFSSYLPYMAFDGDSGTVWGSINETTYSPQWLMIDLGEPKLITKYSLRYEHSSFKPTSFSLQGSNNETDWSTLDEQGNVLVNTNTDYYFEFDNNVTFRYIRLYVKTIASTGTFQRVQISEIKLYESEATDNLGWNSVSSTLPTSQQFLSDGMDSLSPLLDRSITTLEPQKMSLVSSVQSNEAKVFSKTISLKKYIDVKSISVKNK